MTAASLRDTGQGPARLVVRRVTPNDAATYAALMIEIWRETYEGLMPAERLARVDLEQATARARVSRGP